MDSHVESRVESRPESRIASRIDSDCVVVGASFAGLACARAAAAEGLAVRLVEKKIDVGAKLHTTGIIVKDAFDDVALLHDLPATLTRRIDGVRLYAPNLRFVDLRAPGYYFLATDTPELMRWLAQRAIEDGVALDSGRLFETANTTDDGFEIPGIGRTRYLVGADGPHSRVAKLIGLGVNRRFLYGVEHEYTGVQLDVPDVLHCFIDRRIAPGYIGWVLQGVGVVQVGLARRLPGAVDLDRLIEKIAPVIDLSRGRRVAVRAGMIPCGGVVRPASASRTLLVGDAAGMVSPVTAGGIHTALRHGTAAGHAIADFVAGRSPDPALWLPRQYPRFVAKRVLRFLYDHLQMDWPFDLMLATPPMRMAASLVYFHRKGVAVAKG